MGHKASSTNDATDKTTKSSTTSKATTTTIPILEKHRNELDEDKLEQWIRRKAPGILLYTKEESQSNTNTNNTDEYDCMDGQSIESQLRKLSWFEAIMQDSHPHGYKVDAYGKKNIQNENLERA